MNNVLKSLFLCLALSALVGCGDNAESGNSLTCTSGDCSSTCDNAGTTEPCSVACESGTTCDARCNDGQSCSFSCNGATCDFDCRAGSCSLTETSGAMCSCQGMCPGTCGGVPGSDAGTGGCVEACGSPADPGYAECVAACG